MIVVAVMSVLTLGFVIWHEMRLHRQAVLIRRDTEIQQQYFAAAARDADDRKQEMLTEVYDGFGPHGEPDSIIRNGTDRTLYEHDPICDCERCRPGDPGDYEDSN